MLAKQGWRLLTDPSSLCARVLKAKYYSDTDVLQAKPKDGMSYTWKSILKGVKLLKEGVIKRVGDGNSVNIWRDPWLPRNGGLQMITPRGQILVSTAAELMDPYSACWDEQLVRDTLWPIDANVVLSIPIRDGFQDFWAWHRDPKGNFSLKSAYKLHRTLLEPRGSASGTWVSENLEMFKWNDIW
jgi:hypothetical protein